MVRISVGQPFRMKLHAQQERHAADALRFKFQRFDDPIIADCDGLQRLGHLPHRLMMRAVHAQLLRAGYLGE